MSTVVDAENLLATYAKGSSAGTSVHWAILDAGTGCVIGDAGIMSIDSRNRRASSYCILDRQYWGKGLSSDAMKLVFDHVFMSSGLNRIQAFIDARNTRTIRSVRGIGLAEEGVLREYEVDRGDFIDDAVFALTRCDWSKRRHVVFGNISRDVLARISWQRYVFDGKETVWLFDSSSRRYHLLTGVEADAWTRNPQAEFSDHGFTLRDAPAWAFMSKINDLGAVYEVHWDVTNVCNSLCRHCYNEGAQSGRQWCLEDEMPEDECLELLKTLREKGVFRIVFSGGEPLMRPHMLELIRSARRMGFQVVLYTNGLLVDEACADAIAALGLASVDVSCYGASPDGHDSVTRVPGSFDKSVNALRLLTKRGVHTVMKCVALHGNCLELETMKALGRQVAEDVLVNYVFYPGIDGNEEINGQMLRMSDIVALALDPHSGIHCKKQSLQLCRYESGREHVCTRVVRSLYLNSRGDVFPCIAIPQSAGSWRDVLGHGEGIVDPHGVLDRWWNLRFSDIPQCGKRPYCSLCHSACPGDGFAATGNEHAPPTNHCRLAIGRYIASQWDSRGQSLGDWNRFSSDEESFRQYAHSLGIEESEYVVGGIC